MWQWDLDPSVLVGSALLVIGYNALVGPIQRRVGAPPVPVWKQMVFHLGTLCMFIALVSPLDTLGDTSLFSAHMAQHMLLTFAAPPLWLLGTPGWFIEHFIPARLLTLVTRPAVAFAIFTGVMWGWHLPAAYDAALLSPPLHIFEHLTFMGAAVIGWYPVLGPVGNTTPNALFKLAYLFPSMFSCTALAALITLSPNQLYTFYGTASLQWGLAPLADQQLGGLVMWLPGDMLYLFLIVWLVKTLLDQSELKLEEVRA